MLAGVGSVGRDGWEGVGRTIIGGEGVGRLAVGEGTVRVEGEGTVFVLTGEVSFGGDLGWTGDDEGTGRACAARDCKCSRSRSRWLVRGWSSRAIVVLLSTSPS